MKSVINIYCTVPDNRSVLHETCMIACNNYGKPEQVWADVKNVINSIKNNVTYEKFINTLLTISYPNYSKTTDEITDVEYWIDLFFEDTVVSINAYNTVNKESNIECFKERYIFSINNEGNCIDDFIYRGVEPLVTNIIALKESIKGRLPERQIAVEYHSTGCYEKDFAQISLIKKQAEKIVENCNKHLERISEFYTRL